MINTVDELRVACKAAFTDLERQIQELRRELHIVRARLDCIELQQAELEARTDALE
jgi:prefoldin subunit 5